MVTPFYSFSVQRMVNLVESLGHPSCFCSRFRPSSLRVFGGKCTTVFGAINMLSAFARVEAVEAVEAVLCLLPLAKFAMREWVRRRKEKRQWEGKAEERKREASGDKSGSGGHWKRERDDGEKRSESGEEGARDDVVDSSSNVTFGQNRRSLESNYRYARWKLRIIYASSLFGRSMVPLVRVYSRRRLIKGDEERKGDEKER